MATDNTKEVVVIIPLYNPILSNDDRISLDQTCSVLARYPLVVVHPEGMALAPLQRDFPQLQYRAFNADFFRGVEGYNRFMLSKEFYAAFLDYDYLLICQLDCFIFKDELHEWCQKGYDYIGAPWLKRSVYNLPIFKQFIALRVWLKHCRGQRTRFDRYGKIGNGGLSLRKVRSHYDVICNQPDVVALYADENNRRHLFNEDTFWAMEPQDFRYPTVEEACLFSYNKYPGEAYRITHGATPFGCHGWTKRGYREFWCKDGDMPKMPE